MDRPVAIVTGRGCSANRSRQVRDGWGRSWRSSWAAVLAHHRPLRLDGFWCWAAAISVLVSGLSASASGIPEPGLALYGAILNADGSVPSLESGVVWCVTAGTNSVTVPATVIGLNGQFFYLALVPFETRSIDGVPAFTAGANALELQAAGASYTRAAIVNGTNALLQGSDTFHFGPGHRGRAERLDLRVNLPRESFTQWALRLLGTTNLDLNADPLGKGMTYYQQYIAGTDPLDINSVFKFVGIAPAPLPNLGVVIQWESVPGRIYTVLRASAESPGPSYLPVTPGLAGTNTLMEFCDRGATGAGPYFYRLQVRPP